VRFRSIYEAFSPHYASSYMHECAPCAMQRCPVIDISEVMPSRGVRALEGEGRGLSHLEVIARGAVVALAS
jgi:hypothetical protein